MSYDKTIGLGHDKASDTLTFSDREKSWLQKLRIPPIPHDLKSLLPAADKEPEPKLLIPGASSFGRIRSIIQRAPNGFMIPDQIYSNDPPLVSLLLDTKHRGLPTCKIVEAGYSLRWRANMDTKTGHFSQRDFNEKSTAATSSIIGGCIDRDERERECSDTETNEQGYEEFLKYYRNKNNPAFCDEIPFDQLTVYAGYMTARTMYGFAVKHPQYNVLLICEACEDHTLTFAQDMQPQVGYKEFEFEPKQIIGDIPTSAQSPESFKLFLYDFMRKIQDHIRINVHGSELNTKSKADFAREHLQNCCAFDRDVLQTMPLAQRFQRITNVELAGLKLIPEMSATYYGHNLDHVIQHEAKTIQKMAARLLKEKRMERNFALPDENTIGTGCDRPFLSAPPQREQRLHLTFP